MIPKVLPNETKNPPSVGDLYEECIHTPASTKQAGGDIHWWKVDGKWIALCDKCHVVFMTLGKVRISVGTKRIIQPPELTEGRN